MIKKLKDIELADLTGFDRTTFVPWKGTPKKPTTPQKIFRYQALLFGATLLHNGFNFENIAEKEISIFANRRDSHKKLIAKLLNEIKEKDKEIKELEDGINAYADKFKALKGLKGLMNEKTRT